MNWRIPKACTLSLNCVVQLNLFVKRRSIKFKIKTMLIAKKESNLLIIWARRLLAGDGFRRGAQNIARALHLFSMFGNLLSCYENYSRLILEFVSQLLLLLLLSR